MTTEDFVLNTIKKTEHGVKFINTVENILEAIMERVWFEDLEGNGHIENVVTILNHYINFEIHYALRVYYEVRNELKSFISGIREKQDTEIRVNTWDKIEAILGLLETDAWRFLEISGSEVTRLQREIAVQ